MGYFIEITEDKAMDMKEQAWKILKHAKQLFECIEEIAEDSSKMGERGSGGNRGGGFGGGNYGNRMNYREEEDYDDDDSPYMGERRGRSSRTGRYTRR